MGTVKTNVMRILDKANISYQHYTYAHKDNEAVDGINVATQLGQPVEQVFKTLVTKGVGKEYYVFVIPVHKELNLKAAACSVGEKSVELIPVKEINKITGYVRGGCSPIGMKKAYKTMIDSSVHMQKTIIFSGGKIGVQVEIIPNDLIQLINAQCADIVNAM